MVRAVAALLIMMFLPVCSCLGPDLVDRREPPSSNEQLAPLQTPHTGSRTRRPSPDCGPAAASALWYRAAVCEEEDWNMICLLELIPS